MEALAACFDESTGDLNQTVFDAYGFEEKLVTLNNHETEFYSMDIDWFDIYDVVDVLFADSEVWYVSYAG